MHRTQPPRKDKNRVPRVKAALPAAPEKDAERVAKVIARAGLGSRREIEDWILAGRVAVNGTVLASPAFTVTPQDSITIDGQPLPERERTRLFLYHKPKGVVTTNRDPEGRTTLFEILPKGLPRLVSVGRLDLNSEGLLLLTNDGGLARILELPETGWLRRYRVRAKGEIDQARLDALITGITVDTIEYGPIEATLDRVQGANAWITVALREGKNREVRIVLGALGLQVNRLIRISYGPFQLGEIAEGGVEEVRTRVLRDQLGADIIAASSADLTGPVVERTLEAAPQPSWRIEEPAEDRAPRRSSARPAAGKPRVHARAEGARPREDAPPLPRGRQSGVEREVESRGTVADRKGREIRVERLVTRPGSSSLRPPSGTRGFKSHAGHAEGAHRPARRREDEDFSPRTPRPYGGAGADERRAPRQDRERPAFGKGPRRFERDTGAGHGFKSSSKLSWRGPSQDGRPEGGPGSRPLRTRGAGTPGGNDRPFRAKGPKGAHKPGSPRGRPPGPRTRS